MSVPSSRIAVIGAGVSALVIDLVASGYRSIDAVDLSDAALDRLRARLGDRAGAVRFVCADVRDVVFDGPVDVWHDRATFHFLTSPTDQARYVQRAADAVVPGGHLVLAGFSERGPEQCSGLPVTRHSVAALTALFSDCFSLESDSEFEHVTPWGTPQSFTHTLWRRRDSSSSATG